MSDTQRIVILGGHGKVALLAIPKLAAAGYAVDAIIRNPVHGDDVRAAGANPVVLDIEHASTADLTAAFDGASAIVFSAGAGGGSAERTRAVDFDAATRAMAAAEQAGVKRFLMVSYAGVEADLRRLDPADSFYPYVKAKHDADDVLRQSNLDYTILGPALLTLEPATGTIQRTETVGADWPNDQRVTSRDNVAEVITYLIRSGRGVGETVNFYDGDVPIAEAIQ